MDEIKGTQQLKLRELQNKEKIYQESIAKLKIELEENLAIEKLTLEKKLTNLKESKLMQLKKEIANQYPNSPQELKELLMQEETSILSTKQSLALSELERLKKHLTQNLIRIGKNLDDFLADMELNPK